MTKSGLENIVGKGENAGYQHFHLFPTIFLDDPGPPVTLRAGNCVVGIERYRGYLFFSVKDRNLFHRVDTIGNIFTSGAATRENITNGVHSMK